MDTRQARSDRNQALCLERLAALHRIGCELNATLDVDPILRLIIREVVSLTRATQGSVLLVDPLTGALRPRAWHGLSDAQLAELDGAREDIAWSAFTSGEVVTLDGAQTGAPARSGLAVPLCYAQQVVGVIALTSSQEDAFDPESRQFVSATAEQAVIAVGNAQRYAEQVAREDRARRRYEQLRDLIAISRVLHAGHDLADVLDQIVQAIPASGGFNIAVLSLVQGEPPVLQCVAAAGIPLDQFERMRQVQQPLAAVEQVMRAPYQISRSYLLPHEGEEAWSVGLDVHVAASAHGRPVEGAQSDAWRPGSVLIVPLHDTRGQLLGILSVDDPQDRRVPGQDEIEVLELFANEAASAIENARLHDELELRVLRRTEELAEALQRQASEVEKTRQAISDAVVVFSPKGRVTLANPATSRVLGVAPEAVIGHGVGDAEADQAVLALLRAARSAFRSLQRGQDLVDAVYASGDRTVHASFSTVALRPGEPMAVVAVLRDITREAEVDRRRFESISMMAHELRAPMTSITSYADVLMQGVVGPVNEQQVAFLEVIKSNAVRLTALVNDLLDVARSESEGWKLDLESVSMAEIVHQAVDALSVQIEARDQRLEVVVPGDLPPVWVDRNWMVQVITNLLSNAVKYSPAGSTIAVRGEQIDDRLRLAVEDAGIGISAEDQKHLFTRFFRADDAAVTQEQGTGLGLAICREILVRHGGTVQVDSELGKGSTFSIVLPLASTDRAR